MSRQQVDPVFLPLFSRAVNLAAGKSEGRDVPFPNGVISLMSICKLQMFQKKFLLSFPADLVVKESLIFFRSRDLAGAAVCGQAAQRFH